MAGLMGRGPHLAPITAMVRRRAGAARLLIGGRNLAGPNDPAAHFRVSIDGVLFQEWDASPGFFLKVFDIPAGRLAGAGHVGDAVRAVDAVGDPDRDRAIRRAGRTGDDVGL